MNIASDFLAPFTGLHGFGNKQGGLGGTGHSTIAENYSSKLSWRDQRSTDVTLVTGDGDRVTLSSVTDRQASFEVYNASGSINGTSSNSRMETFNLSSGKSMSISVEGELSEQERADIALVASTVDKMATEFFDGDVDAALASILDSGGAGTVSSISASMSHKRSFSFAHQSVEVLGAPSAAGDGAAPQGVSGTQIQEPGVITLDSTLGFISEMSDSVAGMGIELGEIEEELFELMDELFEEIAKEQDPNKAMDRLVHFVKDEFMHELKEIIEDAFEHDDDHDDDDHDDDNHEDSDKIDGHHARTERDHDDHQTAPVLEAPVPEVDASSVSQEPKPAAGIPV